MSITYTFTGKNSIRVQCGGEWIEIGLPGATADHPDEEANPPLGRKKDEQKPVVSGEDIPPIDWNVSPGDFPSTMLVVASGKKHDEDGVILRAPFQTHSGIKLSDFSNLGEDEIGKLIQESMSRHDGFRTVDVKIDTPLTLGNDALRRINTFVQDFEIPVDAFRLWK